MSQNKAAEVASLHLHEQMPMHVCLITSNRPAEVFYGGEEKFTILFRNWLISHGNVVTIVGYKLVGVKVIQPEEVLYIDQKKTLVQPRVLHQPNIIYDMGMLIFSLLSVLQIIAINRKSRISIIHSQDTGYAGLSSVLSAKILRVPVIITSHGVRYFTLRNAVSGVSKAVSLSFAYWLDNIVTKTADLVVGVSSTVSDFFTKIGVKKSKIIVIPIGIETENFSADKEERQEIRSKLDIYDGDVMIGFVGRLSPEKNLLTLLEAFVKVLSHTNKITLMLVGTGPMEEKLRKFSLAKSISDKVRFMGLRLDVSSLLSAVDIFALPSYTEGCPTSLLEAMASGKAIVASDIPSIREIAGHGKEAILVNPYNVEELKQAILLLHNNPDLRIELGLKARERAKLFDVDRVHGQILNEYKNLVASQHMESTRKAKIGDDNDFQ